MIEENIINEFETDLNSMNEFKNTLSKVNTKNYIIDNRRFPEYIFSVTNNETILYNNKTMPTFKEFKTFKINLSADLFKKNEILYVNKDTKFKVKVIKVYNGWWRKVLLWLGFRVKLFDGILVKKID